MRWIWGVLAACGGGGGPTCKDVVHGSGSDAALLVGYCEQDAWSAETRACLVAATTRDAVEACLPDPPEKALVLAPSRQTLDLFGANPKGITATAFVAPTDPVAGYLAQLPGLKVTFVDRYLDHALAERYKMYADGVVFLRGDRDAPVPIPNDAHSLLRVDHYIASALAKLTRDVRRAYLVAGHGELTEPGAHAPGTHWRTLKSLPAMLTQMELEPAPLHLDADVPADAALVLWIGPASPLTADEEHRLVAYLARGGALLVALDPELPVGLGGLEPVLGVHFDPVHLVDDTSFLTAQKTPSDHRLIGVKSPGPHPALARSAPLILIDSGALALAPMSTAKVEIIASTPKTTFIDRNGNFVLDGDETRQAYPVIAASTGAAFRALVFADADQFVDVAMQSAGRMTAAMPLGPSFPTAIHWLIGPSTLVGELPPEPPHAQFAAIDDALAARKHVRDVRALASRMIRAR